MVTTRERSTPLYYAARRRYRYLAAATPSSTSPLFLLHSICPPLLPPPTFIHHGYSFIAYIFIVNCKSLSKNEYLRKWWESSGQRCGLHLVISIVASTIFNIFLPLVLLFCFVSTIFLTHCCALSVYLSVCLSTPSPLQLHIIYEQS